MSASNRRPAILELQSEFEFTAEHFQCVKQLIYRVAGISLADSKRSMVYSRLVRRLRITGAESFDAYLRQLDYPQAPEWEYFVNALTTNLTSFFRESHHFDYLKQTLLTLAQQRPRREINIWCCAASTGEEPYTIAITAMEAFGSETPPVRILATDIDTHVLETAQRGVYSEEQVKKVGMPQIQRYFLRGKGTQDGQIRIRDEVKRLLSFRAVNLLAPDWRVRPGFDMIFCRNVMIYFDKPTQMGLLSRFAPLLNQEGLLFVGHSESFTHAGVPFKLLGKTIYQVLPDAAFREMRGRS
ncbi:MAG: chemotaxis protein CheR [Burkholderiaceae bacterium]|nr:MAG: chemotaxis protein CheR [Burkholderiaceae bacterium]